MNYETLDTNPINAATGTTSGIIHIPAVYDDISDPTNILAPIKPNPDTHMKK